MGVEGYGRAGGGGGVEENYVRVGPGEDPSELIGDVSAADPRQSGRLKLSEGYKNGTYHDTSNWTLPLEVPEGVVIDCRRTFINHDEQRGAQIFSLRKETTVLGQSAYIRATVDDPGIFVIDADKGTVPLQQPVHILGYPHIETKNTETPGLLIQQTTGNSATGVHAEISANEAAGRFVSLKSTDANGWVNGNVIRLVGEATNGTNLIEFVDGGSGAAINGNLVEIPALQTTIPDRLVFFDGGSENIVRGRMFDPVSAEITPWEWTANSGDYNRILQRALSVPDGVDNSGEANTGAFTSWMV